ncbi:carboxymuconolactone decarboxylase family protein [Sorangium sp. So ce1000]|uniref:carboxymuconolactone decarboxylase family protein n=1 Tax=Sorangium sp. So ce1000 TaxID=3133325 RepID=UPI003F64679B
MKARMKNPATVIPDVLQPIYALIGAVKKGGVPARTLELVHLRASQINGCGFCVDIGAREMKKTGETDERLFAVAAWREAPYFTDAERAALALAEAATRLSDRADPVPDDVWEEAARHYDEPALAALTLHIALTNFFNRVNVTTKQVAGSVKLEARADSR